MLIACTNPDHTKSDIVVLHARIRSEHKAGSRVKLYIYRFERHISCSDNRTSPALRVVELPAAEFFILLTRWYKRTHDSTRQVESRHNLFGYKELLTLTKCPESNTARKAY